uniref:TF-B3 domain-containing protein n=1 Tax=Triticum urartu TaxID=4572 RepID=A0A8R7QYC8_TRIUA
MMFYKMFLFTSGETSGWQEFVAANEIQEGHSIVFVYRGNSTFRVNISNISGHENPSSFSEPPPKIFGAIPPPHTSCDHRMLMKGKVNHHLKVKCFLQCLSDQCKKQTLCAEQVVPDPSGHVDASTVVGYTLSSGCCLTKAQEEKVLELAHRMRSGIPLHVATMAKRNVKLKDSCIYIPLRLVDHFEPDITLKDHEEKIHGVRARKHDADQIVLESGWSEFVSKQRIQENDLIVFKKGKPHIEVFILEKTSSSFFTGNCSYAQEVIELSCSDDDDIVVEGTRKSRRLSGCCVKAKKMASVSPPCARSEYGAPNLNEVVSEPPRSNNFLGPSRRRRYILAQRKGLKGQARKKVEEKVQAICSEFP